MKIIPRLIFAIVGCSLVNGLYGQMITGAWHGKINRQKVEVKIIQNGDSLTGTSYYYESANNYRRYSIKGYFDVNTGAAVWWDDRLLEEKTGRLSISNPGKVPLLSSADFNCPGGGVMMLDGKVVKKDNHSPAGEVHLDKSGNTVFEDEWDYIIDNYLVGGNDPELISSIEATSLVPENNVPEKPFTESSQDKRMVVIPAPAEKETRPKPVKKTIIATAPVKEESIEEKFTSRTKIFVKEVPLSGDSLELRFYDNAEIDGDSISLFLNEKLLYQHIRLTANPYIIKLAISSLETINELTMVAENMGAIPPNTAYMVAIINNVRHDAYLSSTEGSSAMIRFIKNE